MTDGGGGGGGGDRYFPQVMGAYNSTQHSTTGVSPHMMLTGQEKSLPLTFFYPEYEGKKTSPQVYVRDVIRRQQELNDLCRRNTQQAQARQRKRFDKKAAGAKAYSVGDYVWVFQNVIPPKGTKKLLKKWRRPFMITEVHQEGRFYRLSTGRAAHCENIKPHNPSAHYENIKPHNPSSHTIHQATQSMYTCRYGRRGLSNDESCL